MRSVVAIILFVIGTGAGQAAEAQAKMYCLKGASGLATLDKQMQKFRLQGYSQNPVVLDFPDTPWVELVVSYQPRFQRMKKVIEVELGESVEWHGSSNEITITDYHAKLKLGPLRIPISIDVVQVRTQNGRVHEALISDTRDGEDLLVGIDTRCPN